MLGNLINAGKSEEDKKEQFQLFEYANYCGLVLGIVGSAIVGLFILWQKNGWVQSNERSSLITILIIGSILYLIIRSKVYQLIGVSDSVKEIYSYEQKNQDLYKISEHFINKYKASSLQRDSSVPYKLDEEKNKQYYNSKKKEANIIISHKRKRNLNIRIEIKENLIGVIRPTTSEAAEYHNKLRTFLMEQLQDSSLLMDIKQIDQVQIEGE